MRRAALVVTLAAACGGSNAAPHDGAPGADGPTADARWPIDAIDGPGEPSGPIYYAPTPTQQLVPPPYFSAGVLVAVSANALRIATMDSQSLYIYDRSDPNAEFPSSPSQTVTPAAISALGNGISLSADGTLLACNATGSDGSQELLVFTQHAPAYDPTPQVIPISASTQLDPVSLAGLSPDGSALVYSNGGSAALVLARDGSAFSASPAVTLTPPPGTPTSSFGVTGGFTSDGTTLALGGDGTVRIYSGSPLATTPVATLTAPPGRSSFGSQVAIRPDGHELVALSDGSAQSPLIEVYVLGSAGYEPVQTLTEPDDFFGKGDLSLAADGTLVVGQNVGDLYVFAPGPDLPH